uniref:Secreted protein n=1 Tax=Steinernema glaseri TaxID=37863 RepID=A0A1I7Y9R3_9BILA
MLYLILPCAYLFTKLGPWLNFYPCSSSFNTEAHDISHFRKAWHHRFTWNNQSRSLKGRKCILATRNLYCVNQIVARILQSNLCASQHCGLIFVSHRRRGQHNDGHMSL